MQDSDMTWKRRKLRKKFTVLISAKGVGKIGVLHLTIPQKPF
jgi:hypothetical protein